MSFIPKNPLSMPEIKEAPSTLPGTRGLFAKEDGWYEIDSNGVETKISGSGNAVGVQGTGENSVVFNGNTNKASGVQSFAQGHNSDASGDYSHAEGYNVIANMEGAHAEGYNAVATEGLKFSDQPLSYIQFSDNVLTLSAADNFFENNSLYAFRVNNIGAKPNDRNYINILRILSSKPSETVEGAWEFEVETPVAEMTLSTPNSLVINAILYDDTIDVKYSHVEGYNTHSIGNISHAEGHENMAFGEYSHAEGWGTIAGGIKSGKIRGKGAHAEGYNTWAKENYTHAEGAHTVASGSVAHAEGQETIAEGNISHAEGAGTHAKGAQSHTEGKDTYAEGNYSHAEGLETKALQKEAHAEGYKSEARGEAAHAEGYLSIATGNASHVEGHSNHAEGHYSHAEGNGTHAKGIYSHTEGQDTQTTKEAIYAHAEGRGTIANIPGQHVQGIYNKCEDAEGNPLNYAHVVGNGNEGTRSNAYTLDWNGNGWYAGNLNVTHKITSDSLQALGLHAGWIKADSLEVTSRITSGGKDVAFTSELIGRHCPGDQQGGEIFNDVGQNKATGQFSHAEGTSTTASSTASHAEGWGSQAPGNAAHAEGRSTVASGMRSHSEGYQTKAQADHSHTEGEGTVAIVKNQHVQGRYNKYKSDEGYDLNTYAHVVGNGLSDTERSNAHTLDWNGNAWYAGNITVGENREKLATDNDVKELKHDIATVESIAKGANQAVSFANYAEMAQSLSNAPKDKYNVGQNIMILELDVPDLWISYVYERHEYHYTTDEEFIEQLKSGSVQIGFYSVSPLETQKVDLTDYAKKDQLPTKQSLGLDKVDNTPDAKKDVLHATNASCDEKGRVIHENYSKRIFGLDCETVIEKLNNAPQDYFSFGHFIITLDKSVPVLFVRYHFTDYVKYEFTSVDDFVNQLKSGTSVRIGYYAVTPIEVDLSGCATKKEVGDIETALDNIIAEQEAIIAIQNSLIGGDSV